MSGSVILCQCVCVFTHDYLFLPDEVMAPTVPLAPAVTAFAGVSRLVVSVTRFKLADDSDVVQSDVGSDKGAFEVVPAMGKVDS